MATASYPLRTNDRYTASPVFRETSRSEDRPPMSTPIFELVNGFRSVTTTPFIDPRQA
jgi:hypothetical protein